MAVNVWSWYKCVANWKSVAISSAGFTPCAYLPTAGSTLLWQHTWDVGCEAADGMLPARPWLYTWLKGCTVPLWSAQFIWCITTEAVLAVCHWISTSPCWRSVGLFIRLNNSNCSSLFSCWKSQVLSAEEICHPSICYLYLLTLKRSCLLIAGFLTILLKYLWDVECSFKKTVVFIWK